MWSASLRDADTIEVLIHSQFVAFSNFLLIRITGGKFSCQFWNGFDYGAVRYATTAQRLILDKKAYKKGDVIKGRIDFECFSELIHPHPASPPSLIRLYGVFKTIVE